LAMSTAPRREDRYTAEFLLEAIRYGSATYVRRIPAVSSRSFAHQGAVKRDRCTAGRDLLGVFFAFWVRANSRGRDSQRRFGSKCSIRRRYIASSDRKVMIACINQAREGVPGRRRYRRRLVGKGTGSLCPANKLITLRPTRSARQGRYDSTTTGDTGSSATLAGPVRR